MCSMRNIHLYEWCSGAQRLISKTVNRWQIHSRYFQCNIKLNKKKRTHTHGP